MAKIISVEATESGWVIIKDSHRCDPVSVCPEGIFYLVSCLNACRNPDTRKRFYNRLHTVKSPETKYFMMLAIDNASNADTLIRELTS